jgi:hypothetical protein
MGMPIEHLHGLLRSEFREFHFDRNQPLIDALYNKWRLVAMCLDENVSPPEGEDIGLPLKGPK